MFGMSKFGRQKTTDKSLKDPMTFFLFWDTFYDKDRLMTYSEILYETKKNK